MNRITVDIEDLGYSKLDDGFYEYPNQARVNLSELSNQVSVNVVLSVNYSLLNQGANPVTVSVSDNAGNQEVVIYYVNKDTQLPSINVSADLASNSNFQDWLTQDTNFFETVSISFMMMADQA